MTTYDVIVVGAGHNALVSAAYLAAANMSVLVLEGQGHPGGDAMTESLTLPGYLHDSCSSAHNLIQNTPIIRQNELALESFGLKYVKPDPVYVMPFNDGESLTMFSDRERTRQDIARLSPRDAAAYEDLLKDWEALRPLLTAERNNPPLPPQDNDALWASGRLGGEGLAIRRSSGVDIIMERFEEPHVRAFIAWVAMMTIDSIDRPGTGVLPFSLTAGRQENSWTTPVGGSGQLPSSLARVIEAFGGKILCSQWVDRVIVDNGRATGVTTHSGESFTARRAVLSSAHITQLPGQLQDAMDESSQKAMANWKTGLSMFVTHYAVDTLPRYRTRQGPQGSTAMGALESMENLWTILERFRNGQTILEQPFVLAINSSYADPSRAPMGSHTLKLVSLQPYHLAAGSQLWDAVKEQVSEAVLDTYLSRTTNLTRANLLMKHVESPLDLERRNPNNFEGSCHGGDMGEDQSGVFRPAPAWSGYRTPLDGLYLTGSCTHPGGSISGIPGRNAARVLFDDLGLSWDDALSAIQHAAQKARHKGRPII